MWGVSSLPQLWAAEIFEMVVSQVGGQPQGLGRMKMTMIPAKTIGLSLRKSFAELCRHVWLKSGEVCTKKR